MKNKIIKIVITVVFVLIVGLGILTWGIISGIGFIKNVMFPSISNTTNITSISQNKTDLPKVSSGFQTLSSYNILVASITTAENVKNKQKIILINPGVFFNITKQDILSNNIESQLKNMATIGPVQIINFDKFQIVKKGSFKVNQQNVPYIKGNFGLLSGSAIPAEGVIGVIDTPNSKNNFFISTADSGKFKLQIVENYFKQLKY